MLAWANANDVDHRRADRPGLVTTRAGVVRRPLAADQAIDFIEGWLRQPRVVAHGCAAASADSDFRRFAGIRHFNPLAT